MLDINKSKSSAACQKLPVRRSVAVPAIGISGPVRSHGISQMRNYIIFDEYIFKRNLMSPIFRPVELFVGGIRTIIVDPHNEILPFWFQEIISRRCRLIAVRIDAHHDMFQCCPALPAREGRGKFEFIEKLLPALQEYSRCKVNEGNFTAPAFHYDVLGALYHFHPGRNRIDAYGRVSGSETLDAPKTAAVREEKRAGRFSGSGGSALHSGRMIVWEECRDRIAGVSNGSNCGSGGSSGNGCNAKVSPKATGITLNDFKKDMQDCDLPVAVGFDLDGLYGNDDRGPPEEVMRKRMDGILQVLKSIPRPAFICLARSQSPRCYVPAGIVDRVQELALGLIKAVWL